MKFDVAIIGGGMAGMATALRLQARELSTIVLEAHGQPGGCGFLQARGFSFDVGATTLVDFEPGGVGGELLESVGLPAVVGENLAGYVAWLPDRVVTLRRDPDTCGARTAAVAGRLARSPHILAVDRSPGRRFLAGQPPAARAADQGCPRINRAVRSIGPRDYR